MSTYSIRYRNCCSILSTLQRLCCYVTLLGGEQKSLNKAFELDKLLSGLMHSTKIFLISREERHSNDTHIKQKFTQGATSRRLRMTSMLPTRISNVWYPPSILTKIQIVVAMLNVLKQDVPDEEIILHIFEAFEKNLDYKDACRDCGTSYVSKPNLAKNE